MAPATGNTNTRRSFTSGHFREGSSGSRKSHQAALIPINARTRGSLTITQKTSPSPKATGMDREIALKPLTEVEQTVALGLKHLGRCGWAIYERKVNIKESFAAIDYIRYGYIMAA